MADPPRPPEGPQAREAEGPAPTPRWVYVAGGFVILLALAFAAMHLAGGGIPMRHGP